MRNRDDCAHAHRVGHERGDRRILRRILECECSAHREDERPERAAERDRPVRDAEEIHRADFSAAGAHLELGDVENRLISAQHRKSETEDEDSRDAGDDPDLVEDRAPSTVAEDDLEQDSEEAEYCDESERQRQANLCAPKNRSRERPVLLVQAQKVREVRGQHGEATRVECCDQPCGERSDEDSEVHNGLTRGGFR